MLISWNYCHLWCHTSMFPWEDFQRKKCPGLQQTPWVSAILLLDELLAGNLEGNKRWSWGWFVPDYAITITEYPSLSEHILAPHHPLQISQCKHAHAALCHIVLRILEISMPPAGGRLERRNGNTFDHGNLNYLIRPLIRGILVVKKAMPEKQKHQQTLTKDLTSATEVTV